MDDETKAELLARIKVIEGIDTAPGEPVGLSYQQAGISHRSPHFDLEPLKKALQDYLDGYDAWSAARNMTAMEAAWLAVGKAQRELPVHVANEYCREDRSFCPIPRFNDGAPPRALRFYRYITADFMGLFPLGAFNAGPGPTFALVRGGLDRCEQVPSRKTICASYVSIDLRAIKFLDQERTVALTRLREDLNPPASAPPSCMVM